MHPPARSHDLAIATRRRAIGVLAAGVAAALAATPAPAAAPANLQLSVQQAQANSRPGPRHVPARTIPPPSDLDPVTRGLVAGPYSSYWNLDPPNDAAWRDMLAKAAAASIAPTTKMRAALGVSIAPIMLGGVKAFVLTPKAIPPAHRNQLVLQIHGGGYVFGAGEGGTGEAALMAAYGGYKVIAIDYRMPPDAPFPAALDDLVSAWRALLATNDPRHIAVEGTSTGGGLTLAMMLRLKAEGQALPGAIAPGSPWSDLTKTGDSYQTNEWVDNVLPTYDGYLGRAARLYAHGRDLKDPLLSPVYGDLRGLPPAILTAGTRDLFLSNTVRVHRKLREAGGVADLQLYEGLSHAQFTFDARAPATKEAFEEIARFFDAHLAR